MIVKIDQYSRVIDSRKQERGMTQVERLAAWIEQAAYTVV